MQDELLVLLKNSRCFVASIPTTFHRADDNDNPFVITVIILWTSGSETKVIDLRSQTIFWQSRVNLDHWMGPLMASTIVILLHVTLGL